MNRNHNKPPDIDPRSLAMWHWMAARSTERRAMDSLAGDVTVADILATSQSTSSLTDTPDREWL